MHDQSDRQPPARLVVRRPPDAEDIMPHASQYLRRPAGRERYGRLAIGSYQVQGLAMVLDKLGRGDQRPLEGDLRSEAISQPMRIEPALISGPSSLFGLTNSLFLEKCSLFQCVANLAEKFSDCSALRAIHPALQSHF